MSMLFVSRRNRSEHVTQTLSTSRRRSTIRCRELAAQPSKRADVGRRGQFSRLTGPRAGKLQATELHAETRQARVAIDRLRLRLQLSCPPPPTLADSYHPLDARRLPERLATRPALSMFSAASKLRLYDPLYKYAAA